MSPICNLLPVQNSAALPSEDQTLRERISFLSSATVLLTLLAWAAWQFPFQNALDRSGTPLGGDFPMFYLAGKAVLTGQTATLYDPAAAQQQLVALFPGLEPTTVLPYRYPPYVATCLAPLAWFTYSQAYLMFACGSLILLGVSLSLLCRELKLTQIQWRWTIALGCIGFPLVWEAILGGQASLLAVAIVVGSEILARREKFFLSGALLAMACYKPNLLLFFGLAMLLRYPRIWRGTALMFGSLLLVGIVGCGWGNIVNYTKLACSLSSETAWNIPTPPWKVHGLAEWLAVIFPRSAKPLLGVFGLLATSLIVWVERSDIQQAAAGSPEQTASQNLAVALLLVVQSLANPYLPIYDLTLLLPAILFAVAGLAQHYPAWPSGKLVFFQVLLGWLAFVPHLSQAMAVQGGLKPFSLGLLVLACWLAGMWWKLRQQMFVPEPLPAYAEITSPFSA